MSTIRWSAVVVLVLSLILVGAPLNAEVASKPNVLVIVTDDQRAVDTMEIMPKTRHWLDVVYPQAFATTPLCCPARASIFTGAYAHTHGVTRLGGETLDHSTTLQAILRADGYKTAFFGKYMTGYPTDAPLPEFDQYAFTGLASRYYDVTWGRNVTLGGAHIDHWESEISGYSTTILGQHGATFIDGHQDQPWLMYLSTHAPHLPYTPQSKYRDAPVPEWQGNPAVFEAAPRIVKRWRLRGLTRPMTMKRLGRWITRNPAKVRAKADRANVPLERITVFKRDLEDKPPYIRRGRLTLENAQYRRRQQLRTLMSVDDMVDRVMTKLQDTGQLDNTLVVFLSDNGYAWGEHGRRGKVTPYRESIQVPMLARYPSLEPKSGVVANIDVAPTVLNAIGLPIPDTMDGRSLLDPDWPGRDQILTEHFCTTSPTNCLRWASVRHVSGWQYIENYTDDGELYFSEFYRAKDPWQLENLLWEGSKLTPPPERIEALSQWIRDQGYTPVP